MAISVELVPGMKPSSNAAGDTTKTVDKHLRAARRRGQADAAKNYLAKSHSSAGPLPPFERCIQALRPAATILFGKRKYLLMMLGNRVTWSAIKHWNKGRRRAPEWALEMMAATCERRAAELLAAAAQLREQKEKAD